MGFETSHQLAQQGIRVLMRCRNASKGRATAKKLHRSGLNVEFMQLDVIKPEQVGSATLQSILRIQMRHVVFQPRER